MNYTKFSLSVILLNSMLLLFAFTHQFAAQDQKPQSAIKRLKAVSDLKLKITVGDKQVITAFTDSKTSQDFIKMLPLEVTMEDIRNREKYAPISGELSKDAAIRKTYQVGDVSYWLGGGIAIFYKHDGRQVEAGLIELAHISKGINVFNVPGSVQVKFEVLNANNNQD